MSCPGQFEVFKKKWYAKLTSSSNEIIFLNFKDNAIFFFLRGLGGGWAGLDKPLQNAPPTDYIVSLKVINARMSVHCLQGLEFREDGKLFMK